jgi:G3E family GTPase
LLTAGAGDPATVLAESIEPAVRAFAEDAVRIDCGGALKPAATPYRIDVGHDGSHFHIDIERAGRYVLVVEHAPIEFGLRLEGYKPIVERRFASHHHDEEISSIGLTDPRAVDPNKLNDWLSYLLKSRGADIFRMKGVISIKGEPRRYVFHGVHMMFDGQLERPWPVGVDRVNTLVFIGRNLDRQELEAGFHSCFA